MKIDIWFNDGRCSRCCTPAFARDLVIAKEDELVWAEYLTKKIGELLTPDAIDTPEFKAAEEKVRKDRKMALRFELRKEKEREDYYRRKVMVRPKITFIPKGLAVESVLHFPIDALKARYDKINGWQDQVLHYLLCLVYLF